MFARPGVKLLSTFPKATTVGQARRTRAVTVRETPKTKAV